MAITNQEIVKAIKAGGVVTSLGELAAGDAITLKGDGGSETGQITLNNAGNTAGTVLKSGAVSSSVTFTLPTAHGSNGNVLKTDGNGVLSFSADSAPTSLDSKTLTTATTVTGTLNLTGAAITGASPLVFEGATDNDFETTFAITDATADRTITFPDATGTVAFTSDLSTFITASSTDTLTNKTLTAPVITSVTSGGNAITFPNSTAQTLAGLAEDQTFLAANRGSVTANTAESLTFDLAVTNNFTASISTGTQAITFSNAASAVGQSGNIILTTTGGTVTAHANTKIANGTSPDGGLGTINAAAGVYWLSYICISSTAIYVVASAKLA